MFVKVSTYLWTFTGTTVAVLFGVAQPQVTLAALVLRFVLFYARIGKLLFKVFFFLDNTVHKRVLFFFFLHELSLPFCLSVSVMETYIFGLAFCCGVDLGKLHFWLVFNWSFSVSCGRSCGTLVSSTTLVLRHLFSIRISVLYILTPHPHMHH